MLSVEMDFLIVFITLTLPERLIALKHWGKTNRHSLFSKDKTKNLVFLQMNIQNI